MGRDWDDWEKWKAKRYGRHHDWSRPGRAERHADREARLAEREAERSRRRERRRGRELTPEEEAYREARRAADRKIAFFRHLVPYVTVVLFLTLVAGRFVGAIVALSWGVGLFSHYFQAFVAPGLRHKWVRDEVEKQVAKTVSRQRVVLEDEKLRSLEELSASIAHEIRNPITAAKSLVQQLGEDPSSTENVEYANIALQELDRVEKSISHLLRYAREEEMHPRQMKLSDAVEGALETMRERIQSSGVKIRRDFDVPGELVGDAEQLRRVFINVIGNALDAFAEAHTRDPSLAIALGENLGGSEIWARVKDNGPGMDPDTQSRIFKPFFTSKANGTGLGLAITRKLVDAHGGSIEVTSAPGQGTEFTLHFPKQAQSPEART
ncbi:MAG TPA: ATP-binding protein [Myxococcota bacterium]|nr:ATP-binding protein [Myxococcota bacterium]